MTVATQRETVLRFNKHTQTHRQHTHTHTYINTHHIHKNTHTQVRSSVKVLVSGAGEAVKKHRAETPCEPGAAEVPQHQVRLCSGTPRFPEFLKLFGLSLVTQAIAERKPVFHQGH